MSFKSNDWQPAVLCWSDYYDQPYYNTNIKSGVQPNDHGERLTSSMTGTTQQSSTLPSKQVYRLYFGTGQADYQNSPKEAMINVVADYKGKRVMPLDAFTKAQATSLPTDIQAEVDATPPI